MRAVGEIDKPAIGMDVNRARALRPDAMRRIGKGLLDEQRLCGEIAVRRHLVGDQLILPFDRQIDPRL